MQRITLTPTPSEELLGPGYGPNVWPLRERLALATAVLDRDNQQVSWPSISKRLAQFTPATGRPPDWCSARACAKQYALLLDSAEMTRRQKFPTEAQLSRIHILHPNKASTAPTSGLSVTERLVQRLTAERVEELRERIKMGQKFYSFLKRAIGELEQGAHPNCVERLSEHLGIGQKALDENLVHNDDTWFNEFTTMWAELESFYNVSPCTWSYPSGFGTDKPVNRSRKSAGARLSALLDEASAAFAKGPPLPRRQRPVPENQSAVTRAAVATRQRYLSNVNRKIRGRPRINRSEGASTDRLRGTNAANEPRVRKGAYSPVADFNPNSGPSTPSTTAMTSSDVEESVQLDEAFVPAKESPSSQSTEAASDDTDRFTLSNSTLRQSLPCELEDEIAPTDAVAAEVCQAPSVATQQASPVDVPTESNIASTPPHPLGVASLPASTEEPTDLQPSSQDRSLFQTFTTATSNNDDLNTFFKPDNAEESTDAINTIHPTVEVQIKLSPCPNPVASTQHQSPNIRRKRGRSSKARKRKRQTSMTMDHSIPLTGSPFVSIPPLDTKDWEYFKAQGSPKVALEPIALSPQNKSVRAPSSPECSRTCASSGTPLGTVDSTSLRLRFSRQGSVMTIVPLSPDSSSSTPLFQSPKLSWNFRCSRVLADCQSALKMYFENSSASSQRPSADDTWAVESVKYILDTIEQQLLSGSISSRIQFNHSLLSRLSMLVMTNSSNSTLFKVAHFIYDKIRARLTSSPAD